MGFPERMAAVAAAVAVLPVLTSNGVETGLTSGPVAAAVAAAAAAVVAQRAVVQVADLLPFS